MHQLLGRLLAVLMRGGSTGYMIKYAYYPCLSRFYGTLRGGNELSLSASRFIFKPDGLAAKIHLKVSLASGARLPAPALAKGVAGAGETAAQRGGLPPLAGGRSGGHRRVWSTFSSIPRWKGCKTSSPAISATTYRTWWPRWIRPPACWCRRWGGLGRGWFCFGGFVSPGNTARPICWKWWWPGTDGCRFAWESSAPFPRSISISTGASIGREGGITQLSATAASKWGQLARWQPYRLRLLVACGAAAGMAAAYNAPITGAIFAAHIVLGNFSMNLFAPLLCSSVVATMLSRSFFGMRLWYEVPNFDFTSIAQLPWFVVLGFLAGVLGAVFLRLLRGSEGAFQANRASARAHGGGRPAGGNHRPGLSRKSGATATSSPTRSSSSPPAEKSLGRDFSGQTAGHGHHGRVRRGGRSDHADVVSGGGAGEHAGDGACSMPAWRRRICRWGFLRWWEWAAFLRPRPARRCWPS